MVDAGAAGVGGGVVRVRGAGCVHERAGEDIFVRSPQTFLKTMWGDRRGSETVFEITRNNTK